MKQPPPDTRATLLNAALTCFAEAGYEGTSMRMIAELAQRPLSLLSHYFGNKEGLYKEVFHHIFKGLSKPSDQIHGSPRDKFEAVRMLREQIHIIYQESSPEASLHDPMKDTAHRLWLRELRSPRPELHELIQSHIGPRVDVVRRCIQLLRPELGPSEVAFLGVAVLGQVISHGLMHGLNKIIWVDLQTPEGQFQASELLVDLCLRGLIGKDA